MKTCCWSLDTVQLTMKEKESTLQNALTSSSRDTMRLIQNQDTSYYLRTSQTWMNICVDQWTGKVLSVNIALMGLGHQWPHLGTSAPIALMRGMEYHSTWWWSLPHSQLHCFIWSSSYSRFTWPLLLWHFLSLQPDNCIWNALWTKGTHSKDYVTRWR